MAVNALGESLDRVGTRQQRTQMDNTVSQMRKLGKESGGAAYGTRTLRGELDKVGRPQTQRNLDTTARAMGNLHTASKDSDRAVTDLGQSMERTGQRMRSTNREADGLLGKLGKLGGGAIGLRSVMMGALVPALGLAAQGLSAIGGGAVSLLPKLTDLGGVAGALPATFAGMGLAMGAVKLATHDLSQALSGNQKALKALTPEGKNFLATLKQWQPVVKDLRSSAQQGLFPGLETALKRLRGLTPLAGNLLQRAGAQVGTQAAGMATMLSNRRGDLGLIGGQGVQLIGRVGQGMRNLAAAVIDVSVAARPFTDWLSKTLVGFTAYIREAAQTGRETGRLGVYFDRTKDALQTFGSILGNVWTAIKGTGAAARPLGDDLWHGIDAASKRWADWAQSVRGQGDMRSYFMSLKDPLSALARFVGAMGRGIAQLSRQGTFSRSLDMLTKAVPSLSRGLGDMANNIGPTLVGAVGQALQLFGNLASNTGPVSTLLQGLGGVLGAINGLIDKVPIFGKLLGVALAAGAAYRMGTAVQQLAAKWGLVAKNAGGAALAEREALALSGGGVSGMPGGGVGGVATGAAAAEGAVLGGGLRGRLSGLLTSGATTFAAARAVGLRGTLRAGLGALSGTKLAGGLRAFGKVAAPIAGIMAASDFATTPGTFGQRTQQALSGLTLGLVPGATLGATARQQGTMAAGQWLGSGRQSGTIRSRIGQLQTQLGNVGQNRPWYEHGLLFSNQDAADRKRIQAQLSALHAQLPVQIKLEHQQSQQAAIQGAHVLADQFGQAFQVYNRHMGLGKAMDSTIHDVMQRMRTMGPLGRRTLAQDMLDWAQEQAKQNPKLRGNVNDLANDIEARFRKMGQRVKVVNGQILTGSQQDWNNIATSMITPAQQAQQKVSTAFTAIQREAVGQLTLMGFSGAEARGIVQGAEHLSRTTNLSPRDALGAARGMGAAGARGQAQAQAYANSTTYHNTGATGMRIRGAGLEDTVPVAPGHLAAPGELIVNRHTERRLDRVLQLFGTSLGSEVAGETRPHYAATGARVAQYGGVTAPLASLIHRLDAMGFQHGSTTSGGHAPNSYHYRGEAVDFGDATNNMRKLWSVVYPMRRSFAELFGPNYLRPGPTLMHFGQGFSDAGLQAQHNNHIHIALAGAMRSGMMARMGAAGGGMMMGNVHLRAPHSGVGGIGGLMADHAMAAMAVGLQRRINQSIGGGAGGGGIGSTYRGPLNRVFPRHFTGQGGATLSPGQVASIAASVGLPGRTFAQIAHGESGYQPGVQQRDPGDGMVGYGLWQATPNAWGRGSAAYRYMMRLGGIGAMFNPVKNAMMAKYLYDAAGHSISPWYGTKYVHAMGGRMPEFGGWFGEGGSRRFHRPTLIGVGDGGAEDVTITPAGRGGGGGRAQVVLNFHPGSIVVHGTDGPAAQKFVDHVMDKIASAIDGMGMESEAALHGS